MASKKHVARAAPSRKITAAPGSVKRPGSAKPAVRKASVKPSNAGRTAEKVKPAVTRQVDRAPAVAAGKKPVPSQPARVNVKKTPVTARPGTARAAAKPVAVPARSGRKETAKFSKRDLDAFRKELFALHDHLTGQIGKMRQNALRRDDEVNPEEDGTDAFDRLFTLERAGSEQETMNQVALALRAIDEGTYGVCEACGCLIEKARLQALPFVKNCVKCQSEMERHHKRGASSPRRAIP